MNSILKDIPVANIITPGDIYILMQVKNPGCGPDTIEYLYFIKTDEEIVPSLDMEISYSGYELRKFIGWESISRSCVEFRFLVYDREAEIDVEYSLFLHRIKTLPEVLKILMDDIPEDSLT